MRVILLKDLKNKSKEGDVINVSDGYARNYLIPKEMAVEATKQKLLELESQQKSERVKKLKQEKRARELAARMIDIVVTVNGKAGENGKLFGSITGKDVSEALKEQFDIDIDKKDIKMPETGIKSLGVTQVEAKLFSTVNATFSVNVVE